MADRVRIQNLANSVVMLGQGIPFFHAGQDILRSKSMDRDSFNSGDWFNAVDWTLQTTNWGKGLPVAGKNQDKWPIMQPLLADPGLAPASDDVFHSLEQFIELLEIRKSSPLFRLRTADEVKSRVAFHNTGPGQIPGLIVMSINDDYGDVDLTNKYIVTLFNANDESVVFHSPLTCQIFAFHPPFGALVDPVVQGAYFDTGSEAFSVPGRTTAVFLGMRPIPEQIDVLIDQVNALEADDVLNAGQANALRAKLEAAQESASRDRMNAAANQLNAFINEVAAQSGQSIPAGDAKTLQSTASQASPLFDQIEIGWLPAAAVGDLGIDAGRTPGVGVGRRESGGHRPANLARADHVDQRTVAAKQVEDYQVRAGLRRVAPRNAADCRGSSSCRRRSECRFWSAGAPAGQCVHQRPGPPAASATGRCRP